MRKRKYKYFISFNVNIGGDLSFGNTVMLLKKKLNTAESIGDISRVMEKDNNFPCYSLAVISIQLIN
jgi:hypothetical protein